MMIFMPVLMYLYVLQPTLLLTSSASDAFFTQDQLVEIQGVSLLGVIAFALGAFRTRTRIKGGHGVQTAVAPRQHARLRVLAILVGCIGLAVWMKTLSNVGGFQSAFGQAYGGGWDDSGYVRQLSLDLPFVAILLMSYVVGLTAATVSNCILIVAFGVPLLTQALLGARRGPTFMLVIVCLCAFHLGRDKRPRITKAILVGIFGAVLLLLLISNRDSIYIGSSKPIEPGKMLAQFEIGNGSEYVVGGAAILNTWTTGRIPWGRNWLAEVVIRPIPHEAWPTKWDDWASWTGAAVIGPAFNTTSSETVGWNPAVGAPPGMVAETFAEWSWLSLAVLWCIGRLYAICWGKARSRQGNWPIYYTVCAALSIYVTAQGPLDTIYRFLWIIGMLALMLRVVQPLKRGSGCWLIPNPGFGSIRSQDYP